jgi:uncharacterized protein YbbC (DUF1343 family)
MKRMKLLILPVLMGGLVFAGSLAAQTVQLGNEVLTEGGFKVLQGKRVGLLTNPSGVNRHLESTVDVLRSAPGVKLVALFGPEHGIYGDVSAGDRVQGSTDAHTGLVVHSLYPKGKPTPEMLKDIDVLVYDLQDTGCRSYTFIATMGMAMEACGEAGVEFVVLDRPNPLGGLRVEGLPVEEKFRSGVSKWPVPYVYGMTCGELAQMINGEEWIKKPCKLTVIPLKNWKRSMVWTDTGLPWVPTSPHVPHGSSPMYLVATGIIGELGNTNVSIGVGYTLPFQCVAAPGVDMHKLAEVMNGYRLPGVCFQPVTYKPFYAAFKGEAVSGVQIYFTDPVVAPLTAINFYAIEALRKVAAQDVFEVAIKTKRGVGMFDKVNGSDRPRTQMQAGVSAAEIVASWKSGEDAFRAKCRKYLLY